MKIKIVKHPKKVSSKTFSPFMAEVQYIEGISKKNKSTIDKEYHMEKYGFNLSESEIETFERHKEAWREVALSSEEYVLIIEENVNIEEIKLDSFEIHSLPAEWDIFFPYDMQEIVLANREKINLLNENSREIFDIEPFLTGVEWGSSFYFISKEGAKKLLSFSSCIKQRVEDEIIHLSKKGLLNVFISNVEWMDISNIYKKKHLDRNQNIRNAVLNYNNWESGSIQKARNLLGYVSKIGKSLNIELVLQGGTHLGYVRHGGIMPWDDDIDIGIEESEFERFYKTAVKGGYKITRLIESWSKAVFYKIWHESGKEIKGYEYKFPFIDLWLFEKVDNDIIFKNGITCPNSALFPLKEIKFEGFEFCIPHNSLEVLDSRYKDWRTKIRIYALRHAEEDESNFVLSTSIKVDRQGKLINH